MQIRERLFFSIRAGALHLLISIAVMLAVAALVFGVWYPSPFNQLQGGVALFLLVATIDVICGPLLTVVLWNPRKSRREKICDIGLVVVIQVAALLYGVYSVATARPVYVVYERDRFQVVSVADLRGSDMSAAPENMRNFTWGGPTIIGVELYAGTHPKFLESVQLSLAGIFPAYQPSRWLEYSTVQKEAGEQSYPIERVIQNQALDKVSVASLSRKVGVPEEFMGYLPLSGFLDVDWSVILDRRDGRVLGYLPFDGWQDDALKE